MQRRRRLVVADNGRLLAGCSNLEVSAQGNGAVLVGDRDDRRGPRTPIDFGEDAVVLEAIELCCDLVWKCVGQWSGLEKPRFGSIDEV